MYSIINTIIIIGVVSVLYFFTVSFIGKYLKFVSNRNLEFSDFITEFNFFTYSVICRSIFERLINSKRDNNGGYIALKEFSSMNEPFYNGLIVSVLGIMSDDMKEKFYTFYRKTSDNSALIVEIMSIIDNYSLLLLKRLKMYEEEVKNTNKLAVQNDKSPIDSIEFAYNQLVESIAQDIRILKKQQTV